MSSIVFDEAGHFHNPNWQIISTPMRPRVAEKGPKVSNEVATLRTRLAKEFDKIDTLAYRTPHWFEYADTTWIGIAINRGGTIKEYGFLDVTTGETHVFWNAHPHITRIPPNHRNGGPGAQRGNVMYLMEQSFLNNPEKIPLHNRHVVIARCLKHKDQQYREYGLKLMSTPLDSGMFDGVL